MSTEQELRDLFAADAAAAPSAAGLADGALQKVRRARRARTTGAAGLLVAAGVLGAVVLVGGPGDRSDGPPAAASSAEPVPWDDPSAPPGPVFTSESEDCMAPYSPAGLVGSDIAVDGTVTAIGPEPAFEPEEPQPRVAVTLEVHEWFTGGEGETVTVQMYPPTFETPPGTPPYGVGSRLLVPASLSRDGAQLIASTHCDNTRYYDPATAAEWDSALPESPTAGRTGEVPLAASVVDCVEQYSPEALVERDFAFDGTVVAIGPAPWFNGLPRIQVEVTFEVHRWFRGGPAETTTVEMDPPQSASPGEPEPLYGVGSRLLVSGAARWNADPSSAPIAWQGCGFTRYWDLATAADWAAATD